MASNKGGRNLKRNPLIVKAMENGLIISLDPLEFPIVMKPGAFAVSPQEKKLKKKRGSAAFDPELFMLQNKLAHKPKKAEIRRFLKKSNTNMQLAYALLRGDMGSNPTAKDAANTLRKMKADTEEYKEELRRLNRGKEATQDQWDTILVREYMKNMKKLAKVVPALAKLIKRYPKYVSPLPKIPSHSGASRKSTKKKGAKKPTEKVTSGTKFVNAGKRIKKVAKQKGLKATIATWDLAKRQAWLKKHGAAQVSTRKGGKRSSARKAYSPKIVKKGNTYWRVLASGKKKRTTKAAYQEARKK